MDGSEAVGSKFQIGSDENPLNLRLLLKCGGKQCKPLSSSFIRLICGNVMYAGSTLLVDATTGERGK